MEISFKGQSLDGIINYLRKQDSFNDNVKTYSSSDLSSTYSNSYVIDNNYYTYWHGNSQLDFQYVVVYFPHHYINLKSYVIQTSPSNTEDTCHPWHWAFDASIDNHTWHYKENITDDQHWIRDVSGTSLTPWSHGVYRYFRLWNNGLSSCRQNVPTMDIAEIELFGTLYTSFPIFSCGNKKFIPSSRLSFISCFLLR